MTCKKYTKVKYPKLSVIFPFFFIILILLLIISPGYIAIQQLRKIVTEIQDVKVKLNGIQEGTENMERELRELREQHIDGDFKLQIEDIFPGAQETIMEVTAYAPLDPEAKGGMCYSGNPNITASGEPPVPGETVAAGPGIPFGTFLWIEGIGLRRVNDRGGMITNNRIDVVVETVKEAFQIGRSLRKVWILT